MKKRRKKVNMLEGNLLENVILFALPVIASGIMQLLRAIQEGVKEREVKEAEE